MGFAGSALPVARQVYPDRPAVGFIGDGSFQMMLHVLPVAAEYRFGVTWCVLNDRALGSIRDIQEFGMGNRIIDTDFGVQPDFARLPMRAAVMANRSLNRLPSTAPSRERSPQTRKAYRRSWTSLSLARACSRPTSTTRFTARVKTSAKTMSRGRNPLKMDAKIGETETEKKILFAIDEQWLSSRVEEPLDPAMRSLIRTTICGIGARAICSTKSSKTSTSGSQCPRHGLSAMRFHVSRRRRSEVRAHR